MLFLQSPKRVRFLGFCPLFYLRLKAQKKPQKGRIYWGFAYFRAVSTQVISVGF